MFRTFLLLKVSCPVTDEEDESIDNATGSPDVPEEKQDNCSDSETKLCPVEQQVQGGPRDIYFLEKLFLPLSRPS